MRKIYTGIDLGSDSIKIVVVEYFNNKFNVLASTNVRSVGIKKGLIIDHHMAVNSLRLAISEIENTLGILINEALITVASNDRKITVVEGMINIDDVVNGNDIARVLQTASIDEIDESYELVSVIPITFVLDNDKHVLEPLGEKTSCLKVKAVLATAPKKNVYNYLKVFSECNINVIDLTFNCIADYFEIAGNDTTNTLGAVINIGSDKTDISIFNKNILIKNDIINMGSKNIDRDISYIYGIDANTSRELKEKFSACCRRYADINEMIDITLENKESITINQYEITEIVEARVTEILKIAKKAINSLTKRKISYIIVVGGITELLGFSYVCENVLGINASTFNLTTIGIRNNQYSSAIGVIKYFCNKMLLRGKDISLINGNKLDELMANKKNMLEFADNTIMSKVFGYFTND